MGAEPISPPLLLTDNRAPTTEDYRNFNVGTLWINRATAPLEELWMLVNKDNNVARWLRVSGAGVGNLDTLTGNLGGAVGPDVAANIDVVGAGPYIITGNPAAWTLTLADDGTIATQFTSDAGTGIPAGNVIKILGGTNITTSAAGNTVTIDFVAGVIADQFDTDAGTAIPAAGILKILGGTNVNTTGAGNVVTVNFTTGAIATQYDGDVGSAVPVAGILKILGGTYCTTTAAGNVVTIDFATGAIATQFDTDSGSAVPAAGILQILGDTVITTSGAGNIVTVNMSQGADGQVLIGQTGALPAWGNITSTGGTVTISNGPNTINLESAVGGAQTFTTDSGTATAAANNINVLGGDNINTTGAADNVYVHLNETIHWPDTNAAGTSGMIYLGGGSGVGGVRFMHNYGWIGSGVFANTFLGAEAGNLTLSVAGTVAQNLVGIGALALSSITTGSANTAVGAGALMLCTTGGSNTAVGDVALRDLTTGIGNTAVGAFSCSTSTGNGNTAVGYDSLNTGDNNIAIGYEALQVNTGNNNTCVGYQSGVSITTGTDNTAIGYRALDDLVSGVGNIAIGDSAGSAWTAGEDNNIAIGFIGFPGDNNIIRIGAGSHTAFYAQGIYSSAVSGRDVYVTSLGRVGYLSSSVRYKENIKNLDISTDLINQLRPVTFNYKEDEDPRVCYGLIAEEVDKIIPDLVDRDPDGTIQTIRYKEMIPMLLNEIQKLNKRVCELEKKLP
jgi:hypothetical protein